MRRETVRRAILRSLICFESALTAAAFPRLLPRQDACEQYFCVDWSNLRIPAQQTVDTIGAYLGGLFPQDQIDPQTPTIPTEQPFPGIGLDSNQQNSEFKSPADTQTSPQIPPLAGSEQCTQYAPPVGAPELINEADEILFGMDPHTQDHWKSMVPSRECSDVLARKSFDGTGHGA